MFSRFFIDRPVFACVLSIIIVLAGLLGLKNLPIEEYPQLTPPSVVVSTNYNGADAQTVADTVAAPLEAAINGAENMIYMQSTASSSGSLDITVYFKTGTDSKYASMDVNNRVSQALKRLPDDVQKLGVTVRARSGTMLEAIMFYEETPTMSITELTNYINVNVVDELKRVDGVGHAMTLGAKDYSMRILINPQKLKLYDITPAEIAQAIREQNSQYASGKLGEAPMDGNNPYVFSIVSDGRYKSVEQFENIVLRATNNGEILRVKDVADVKLEAQMFTVNGKMNGHESVPIMINLQNGANAIAVADAVEKKLQELKANFPGNITYKVAYDTTEFIKVSIKEVLKTFVEALLLVIIVMYMFLGNLRATIIPMLAVPVSLIGTFGGLYILGFSLNLITLFAMVLAIGIVVDDAIIVIENVERILEHDQEISVKDATKKAMSEIFAPIISIVLVLSAVFIPVAFLGGFVGMIQREFAMTLVISVMISGLVALTLTPALCAIILKKKMEKPYKFVQKFNDFFTFSTKIYADGVGKILRHIVPSLIVVAIFIISMLVLFKATPTGLVPTEDKGAIIATSSLPEASTLKRTQAEMERMKVIFDKNPLLQDKAQIVGFDMLSGSMKENSAVMFLKMIPWDKRQDTNSSVFSQASFYNKIFYMDRTSQSFFMTPPPIMGLSLTGGFEFFAQNLEGKNFDQIYEDMQILIQAAQKRPELALLRTTLETHYPQYKIEVDRDKAKMFGVKLSDIFTTINMTIGEYYINDFNILGKTFKVNIRAASNYRDSLDDFAYLFVKNNKGELIPIKSLIDIKRSVGPDNVDRFNGFPAAKIMGQPSSGYTSGQAIKAISEVFYETFPQGYSIGWSGSAYQEVSSSGTGQIAFIFGLIFVYLILAAQYERWLMPVAVLTAVPFSVFGSLLTTWMRGLSNDVYFQLGLLLLIGLGAKNAILIVEFAMEQHKLGKNIIQASIEAAKMRFRPIVMTSLAFALGVLPMVYSSGAGAASRHSLGTGVIGGMIAASTIAIFFVPLFFYLLESLNAKIQKLKGVKDE